MSDTMPDSLQVTVCSASNRRAFKETLHYQKSHIKTMVSMGKWEVEDKGILRLQLRMIFSGRLGDSVG